MESTIFPDQHQQSFVPEKQEEDKKLEETGLETVTQEIPSEISEIPSEISQISPEISEIPPDDDWIPPSVNLDSLTKTYTFESPLPIQLDTNSPVILGIDEAGRGPVLGPMVYAAAYCPATLDLGSSSFKDSKILKHTARRQLFRSLNPHLYIGYAVTVLSASAISAAMFANYNLNAQAHDTTIALIRRLSGSMNVSQIFVDTVGHPEPYQAKLQRLFPNIEITVAKKADSLYKIVSVASICAKVTRDGLIQEGRGSGYPSDPKTVAWLKENMDPVFGWDDQVRYSWGTAKQLLDTQVGVDWHDENKVPAWTQAPIIGIEWYGTTLTDPFD
ncbi:Ribonuclease H2 subunit A [Neolecta irregularis DAH-3]|uniref:Ribonuclease n=1 Tax=Neolecta irregularis (strain DAH-3) TaxID=1198029 RepID=A0A1U7LTW8_NEOID|nr:Ribonuclease H2 subunit A [Neolecta irregularis DAH-3]|eukprot:OLL26023.1 Ribonuclease H2 subunit A [Neolecta irregularis DAH-3]